MTKISATQILLDNQRMKGEITHLKELNEINVGLINELDEEIVRLEMLCHANGVST